MGAMSLWHDEASAFRRASVRPSSILISKCFFTIFYPILIPFASYDSTRWGIQNFYTEFWNSLNMLIYAHFSKIASSSSFLTRF